MNIALEIIFVALVCADTIITYLIIDSGKGVEIGPVAKYYIDNKAVAIIITVVVTVTLIGWLELVNMVFFLIPAILRMTWLVRKNWRILHG